MVKIQVEKKLKHAEKWVGIKESLKFESEEEERTGKNVETVAEDVQLTQEKSTSNQQCTEVLGQKAPQKDIEKRATDSQTSELSNVTPGNDNVVAAGEVTKEAGEVTTKINDGDGTDIGGDEYIAATDNDNFGNTPYYDTAPASETHLKKRHAPETHVEAPFPKRSLTRFCPERSSSSSDSPHLDSIERDILSIRKIVLQKSCDSSWKPSDIVHPSLDIVPSVIEVPKKDEMHTHLWNLAVEERNSKEKKLQHINDEQHRFRRFLPKFKVWVLDNKIKLTNVDEQAAKVWNNQDRHDSKWYVTETVPSVDSIYHKYLLRLHKKEIQCEEDSNHEADSYESAHVQYSGNVSDHSRYSINDDVEDVSNSSKEVVVTRTTVESETGV